MEAVLKENNIGVWEEDSEEEILDTDDIDLDWIPIIDQFTNEDHNIPEYLFFGLTNFKAYSSYE